MFAEKRVEGSEVGCKVGEKDVAWLEKNCKKTPQV